MAGDEQHDGAGDHEHDSPHSARDRQQGTRSAKTGGPPQDKAGDKLIQVTGSGLSGPFIRRPVMTVLLTLSVIVAGIATYGKLAVNDLPAVDYPVIQVTCSYPGANPTTMANNIATPLEKQFLQIPGLDIITSASTQGNTSFTLQFVLSKSIIDAATAVQADGYRNLIVARNRDGSPVYLLDVAEVRQSVQDERLSRTFWMRGFNPPGSVVVLAVSRQAGANAVEVANSVKALFPELRASLPGSITLVPVFDRSQSIVNSVKDVQFTLVIAFVLVVMVIYVFLGRATDTLIPAVALPLSLLLTVAVMYTLNYSINNLTLMALTLAIGFLVDDAIVFLENVVRRAEHGESILKAAFNSAGEISVTIMSMTLSLGAVFIPLVFLPGLLGRIFREFSVTIIVAILASGLISLTLTPLMCARILGERKAGHKRARMEKWTSDFIQRVIAAYGRALDKFLDRAWLTVPILLGCIFGLWFFFTHLPFTLLPPGDSGFIRGVFIAQEGSSPAQMRAYQRQVNPILQANPAVDKYFTVAGRS